MEVWDTWRTDAQTHVIGGAFLLSCDLRGAVVMIVMAIGRMELVVFGCGKMSLGFIDFRLAGG